MTAVQVCSLLFCRDPACTACCVPHLLSPTYVGPLRRLSARCMWTCTPCLRYARRASPAGGPPRDLAQDRAHDRAGDWRPPRGAFLLECMYRRECCPSLAGTFCRGGAVSPAVTSSAVGAGAQQQAGRACTASCQLYKKVTGCSLTVPNLFGRRGSAWSSTMPRELSPAQWDAAFDTLVEQGFVIIPSYFEGEQLEAMAAAMRRVLPTLGRGEQEPAGKLQRHHDVRLAVQRAHSQQDWSAAEGAGGGQAADAGHLRQQDRRRLLSRRHARARHGMRLQFCGSERPSA